MTSIALALVGAQITAMPVAETPVGESAKTTSL